MTVGSALIILGTLAAFGLGYLAGTSYYALKSAEEAAATGDAFMDVVKAASDVSGDVLASKRAYADKDATTDTPDTTGS